MASIDHPERATGTSSIGRSALLVAGDVLAFHIVAAIGLASHGELTGPDALPQVVEIALPFAAGWFIVAPFAGAFKAEVASRPRQMLARTAVAWLIACPIGLLLWSLVRQKSIQPAFAIVTLITNMVVLLGWRGVFTWLAVRRNRGFVTDEHIS
jgi:hypothetical protein